MVEFEIDINDTKIEKHSELLYNQYLYSDISEFQSTLKKQSNRKLVFITQETYNLTKLLAIKWYLEDCNVQGTSHVKDTVLLNVINHILILNLEGTVIIQSKYLVRLMAYGYTGAEEVGRLYPTTSSMQQLTR